MTLLLKSVRKPAVIAWEPAFTLQLLAGAVGERGAVPAAVLLSLAVGPFCISGGTQQLCPKASLTLWPDAFPGSWQGGSCMARRRKAGFRFPARQARGWCRELQIH